MITQEESAEQVIRLSALPFWNATTQAHRAELIATLSQTAVDYGHAVETIRTLLDNEGDRLPTPNELRRVAWSCRPLASRRDCSLCHGSGWQIVELPSDDGWTTTAARKCSCRKTEAA